MLLKHPIICGKDFQHNFLNEAQFLCPVQNKICQMPQVYCARLIITQARVRDVPRRACIFLIHISDDSFSPPRLIVGAVKYASVVHMDL